MVGGIQIRTSVSRRHPFHVSSCEKRPVLGLSGLLSVGDGKQDRKNWNATLSSLDSTIKCNKNTPNNNKKPIYYLIVLRIKSPGMA